MIPLDSENIDYEQLTVCRRLAKQIVNDVIERATEEVSKQVQYEIKSTKFTSKRPASLQLNSVSALLVKVFLQY